MLTLHAIPSATRIASHHSALTTMRTGLLDYARTLRHAVADGEHDLRRAELTNDQCEALHSGLTMLQRVITDLSVASDELLMAVRDLEEGMQP